MNTLARTGVIGALAAGAVVGLASPAMAAINDNRVHVLNGSTIVGYRVSESEAAGLMAYKYCYKKISRDDAHWLAIVADSGQGTRTVANCLWNGKQIKVSDA